MWGRTFHRGFHAYCGRNLYEPDYRIAGLGRGRGGLGRGPCAYLIESELFKEGRISKEEEKKILGDNIDLLKKEIQQLEARLNKISEDVE
ncbi:MAG: DUF5320 domain-containing protein [Candidatus Methanofastidiosum sp.]|nr:DUF5320 domain-containing protein [Methanofastidiosum sp.]NYT04530.1 hypothetical protein [Candidatus Methanofastidiosa archaeon]NYT12929.1 hypothetical protein [Candidatus Methanofastidiosa archaeon]